MNNMIVPLTTSYLVEAKRLRKRHLIRIFLIVLVLILSATYMVVQTKDLLLRPDLVLDRPYDGEAFSQTRITIAGYSTPDTDLTVNGLPAYSDETGAYEVGLLFPEGVHIIEVVARNRFGRERSIIRQIVVTTP
jgi:hypothetical protein